MGEDEGAVALDKNSLLSVEENDFVLEIPVILRIKNSASETRHVSSLLLLIVNY